MRTVLLNQTLESDGNLSIINWIKRVLQLLRGKVPAWYEKLKHCYGLWNVAGNFWTIIQCKGRSFVEVNDFLKQGEDRDKPHLLALARSGITGVA